MDSVSKGLNYMHTPHFKKAVFFILVSWLLFTLMYAVSIEVSKTISSPEMVFFRNMISLLCVLPWMITKGIASFRATQFSLVILRSFMSILTLGFMFTALKSISLVDATLLSNTAPFFVPFIIWVWLKKPIQHRLWPYIIAGFVGIALILKPDRGAISIGGLYALAAGLSIAISTVAVRISLRTESIETLLFYLFLVGGILSLPVALFDWKTPSSEVLVRLMVMGILAFLGQYAFVKACSFGRASHLAPFSYSSVVYSGIIDYLVWGSVPDLLTLAGIVIVCISGILSIFHILKWEKEVSK
jgi:drug/metabolite transporter (DMT)-like permease